MNEELRPATEDEKQLLVNKTKEQFHFFTGGVFSQWFPCTFVVDHITYCSTEQYMMAQKALLFDDNETYEKIMSSTNSKEIKELGRQVKSFDEREWILWRESIVLEGNYAKFSQNDILREKLLNTKNKTLVEASTHDRIWGIGLDKDDFRALDRDTWLGQNLLGKILTEIKNYLRNDVDTFIPVYEYNHDEKRWIEISISK